MPFPIPSPNARGTSKIGWPCCFKEGSHLAGGSRSVRRNYAATLIVKRMSRSVCAGPRNRTGLTRPRGGHAHTALLAPDMKTSFVRPKRRRVEINWEQLGNKLPLFLARFTLPSNVRATESSGVMVGAVGIEPTTLAPFPRLTERLDSNQAVKQS
jgi:hypothetical protein